MTGHVQIHCEFYCERRWKYVFVLMDNKADQSGRVVPDRLEIAFNQGLLNDPFVFLLLADPGRDFQSIKIKVLGRKLN